MLLEQSRNIEQAQHRSHAQFGNHQGMHGPQKFPLIWSDGRCKGCDDVDNDGSIDPSKDCNFQIHGGLTASLVGMILDQHHNLDKVWYDEIEHGNDGRRETGPISVANPARNEGRENNYPER
mmetsp:Transcript_10497/g.19134  ORF Transcript_10497/g.19134 Transcript_10497/m.19134 type:complete len:122 (+) Transcript_10497:1365-1730(+)